MKINKEKFSERLDFLMQDRKMNTQCISEYTGASKQSVKKIGVRGEPCRQ